jgi:hypothetical protein
VTTSRARERRSAAMRGKHGRLQPRSRHVQPIDLHVQRAVTRPPGRRQPAASCAVSHDSPRSDSMSRIRTATRGYRRSSVVGRPARRRSPSVASPSHSAGDGLGEPVAAPRLRWLPPVTEATARACIAGARSSGSRAGARRRVGRVTRLYRSRTRGRRDRRRIAGAVQLEHEAPRHQDVLGSSRPSLEAASVQQRSGVIRRRMPGATRG